MVVLSTKFILFITCSPICIPLIGTTAVSIMYNSIESGQLWGTPLIRERSPIGGH